MVVKWIEKPRARYQKKLLTPLVLVYDGDLPFDEGIPMDSRRVYGSFETGFEAGLDETIDGLRPGRSRTSFIPLILLPRSGSSPRCGWRCWSGERGEDAPEPPAPAPDPDPDPGPGRLVRTRCVRFDTEEGTAFAVAAGAASVDDVSVPPGARARACGRLDARDLRDPIRDTCAPAGNCGGGAFEEEGVWPAEAAP